MNDAKNPSCCEYSSKTERQCSGTLQTAVLPKQHEVINGAYLMYGSIDFNGNDEISIANWLERTTRKSINFKNNITRGKMSEA